MPAPNTTPIYRVRLVLTATCDVRLHVHQGGLIYALLASANGRAMGSEDVLPDGLMLDAPELGRISVLRGEPFAFGFTLLAETPEYAASTVDRLLQGLRRVGCEEPLRPLALAGNFEVTEVRDLVAGSPWSRDTDLTCIPRSVIDTEAARIASLDAVTLRFTSPLRMLRPRPQQEVRRECFDAQFFQPGLFIYRAMRRLHELGLNAFPQS